MQDNPISNSRVTLAITNLTLKLIIMAKKLIVSNTKKLKMLRYLKTYLSKSNCFMCNILHLEFPEYKEYKLNQFLPELQKLYPRSTLLHRKYGMNKDCWGTDDNVTDHDHYHSYEELIYIWKFRASAVNKAIKNINLQSLSQ